MTMRASRNESHLLVALGLVLAMAVAIASIGAALAQDAQASAGSTWLQRLFDTGEMRVTIVHPSSGCEWTLIFKGDDLKAEKNHKAKCRGTK